MPATEKDLLLESGLPIFFEVGNYESFYLDLPSNRYGQIEPNSRSTNLTIVLGGTRS